MNSMNGLGGLNGNQPLNRMAYLGNIHPETTAEDLCKAIRGHWGRGPLEPVETSWEH